MRGRRRLGKGIARAAALRHPFEHDRRLDSPPDGGSLQLEKTDKVPLYARAGIGEVWVVDVPHTLVEVYRGPSATGYRTRATVQLGGMVSPAAFPDVVLQTAEIFDSE